MSIIVTPAVVLKSKFVLPSSKEYSDYINYIDRDESKVKQNVIVNRELDNENDFNVFHSFMDYMDDGKKNGELFTYVYDSLSKSRKDKMKSMFLLGQENGSPMWQDVISFDNDWLEEQGIYNPLTKELDEEKMRLVVRGTMSELLKSEEMGESAVWTASIHYNTENIHVHIASIEPFPTREKKKYYDKKEKKWVEQYKARRKQGSLDRMKSRVVSLILDRSEKLNEIDNLIRGAVHSKREGFVDLATNKKTKKLFMKAIENMPDDLRQWRYGYQTIDEARPYIDEIVNVYLDTYHEKDMRELSDLLDEQVEVSKRLYGENSKHEQYKKNQLKDLRKRMGNAVLQEMRSYVKGKKKFGRSVNKNFNKRYPHKFKNWNTRNEVYFSFIRLKNALRKTYHEYQKDRNIEEYDRMMNEGR